MKKIIAGALLAASLFGAPALAQGQAAGGWHQTAISGGCTVAIPSDEGFPPTVTVTWDQPCTPGQPVAGQGTLRMAAGDGRAVTMTGLFVSGVPNGAVVMSGFDATGATRMTRTDQYNMGCQVTDSGGCTPYSPG